MFDVKGHFTTHASPQWRFFINSSRSVKLLWVPRAFPTLYIAHDGWTIHYPDPAIRVNDTVKFDLEQGKIVDCVRFDTGNLVKITGGHTMGRAGALTHREKHVGGFDIIHVKGTLDHTFATRYAILWEALSVLIPIICSITNIFIIGEGNKLWISLPWGMGIKLTISEERDLRRKQAAEQ